MDRRVSTEYFARYLSQKLGTLRSVKEKQAYEFTVYVFNQLLGYLQDKDSLTQEDWNFLGSKVLRVYQVWDILYSERKLRDDPITQWKKAADWVKNSGLLDHISPLIKANEDQRGEILWNLITSDKFLEWALRQVR